MGNKQPKIIIEPTVGERFVDLVISFAAFTVLIVTTVLWMDLPAQVPTKFDFNGNIQEYGSKYVILSLLPVTVLMYALLGVLQRMPHTYNYVVKITVENAALQYKLAVRFMRALKLELVAMFAYLYLSSVLGAKGDNGFIGIAFVIITVLGMFVTIGYYTIKSIKAK